MNVEPAGDPYQDGGLVEARSHPNHWFNRASALRAAAGGLWLTRRQTEETHSLGLDPGFDMWMAARPVYHLLCGMALEVVMKAVLAQQGKRVPPIHRLNELADQVGFDRNETEQRLLNYYSEMVYWAGKYPTPRDPTDAKLVDYFTLAVETLTVHEPIEPNSFIARVSPSGADDWESFHALWQRAAALFQRDRGRSRLVLKVPDSD
jgi:hypothetical protein